METLTINKLIENGQEAVQEFVIEEEFESTEDDSTEPVYHHYTHSTWADGAAMFAAKQVKEEEFTLIVINKDIGAWECYYNEPNFGMASGDWNYAPAPSDIGLSVWIKAKLNKEVA